MNERENPDVREETERGQAAPLSDPRELAEALAELARLQRLGNGLR